jgi:hypothetical protein
VIFGNPFLPQLVVDNDDTPRRFDSFGSVHADAQETRTEAAAKALDASEHELAAARQRTADADRKNERRAHLEREATIAERKRIVSILTAPVALRHPRIAKRVALESDSPADECIAVLEQYERDNAASRTKSTADLIVLAGQMRRGEVAATVTGAGPKVLVKATSEEIIAAGRKARGEG